ncbi:3-hydroxyacyl-[acyl-carrier-protein] dehydratase FabZ, partial [bacterium]|nr:3-hydroxyacyl-[acyl-carrier-protein] dehydratase FabZ [bacterium]
AMAQTAAVFLLSIPDNKGKVPFFASLDDVKFRRQVVPGDQLRIEVTVVKIKTRIAKAEAKGFVGEDLAVEAMLTCILADPGTPS